MNAEERLELVTRFEDLRAGMLVVEKPCECGKTHRGMLTALVFGTSTSIATGIQTVGPKWRTTMEPHPGFTGMVMTPRLVAERRVYRVIVPGADKALDMSTEGPKTKARAR